MKHFNRPTPTDLSHCKLAFRAAGIVARFAMTRYGFRVIFSGDRAPAFAVLNDLGFRDASGELFAPTAIDGDRPAAWEIFVNFRMPA